jgi:nucleotide-binding universal stress UspA family protein
MSYPFKKILSPLQFDDPEFVALGLSTQIAKDTGGTVYLLHVVPILPALGEPETGVTVHARAEDEARRRMEEIARDKLSGLKSEILTRVAGPGETAKALLETASDIDADLIVMKTHGRHGLAHLIMGSVAEQVVRQAHCAVLTLTSAAKERHAG